MVTPLELLNLYYSDGKSTGNKENKLWQKMNELLSWDNILNKGYQSDLCPLLYYIITKTSVLSPHRTELDHSSSALSPQSSALRAMTEVNDSMTQIPNDIMTQLRSHYIESLARNMLLFDELNRVLKAFNEAGIEVIVLKGAALAETVYPDIALRPMGDVDLLIKMVNQEKCFTLLREIGYKDVQENHRIRLLHHSFAKTLTGDHIKIEIHHRLAKDEIFMTNFDLEEVFFHGHIPLEYHIVYLSWHAVHHSFARILWLCDLVEIIKHNNDLIKYDVVYRKGTDFNIQRQLFFCKHLTHTLLMSDLSNSKDRKISHSMLYISESIFLRIQNKIKNGQNYRELRHLLGMCLMKTKTLKTFIPQYIRYRLS
jgi:hypothetical protein